MKNNVFTNTFDFLYKKNVFGSLILLIFSIGVVSLYNYNLLIQNALNFRLEKRLDMITSSISENMNDYTLALSYVNAYFETEGISDPYKLKKYIDSIESQNSERGIQGLGFISLDREKNNSFLISVNEPASKINRGKLGSSLISEPFNKEAIISAIKSGGFSISKPISIKSGNGTESQIAMTMFFPYFEKELTNNDTEEPVVKKRLRGLIYIPIWMNQFFKDMYGSPDLNNEWTNFKIEIYNSKSNHGDLAYERFNVLPSGNYLEKSKTIDLYGQNWKVTATTLPSFFTFTDRYSFKILLILFIIFVILLVGVFFQTRHLQIQEEKSKTVQEDSNKVKSAFLANMSHEIRTPLNAIIGFSKILASSENADEKKYLVENIRKNSNDLTGYIDNILDISQIEFGKIKIEKKQIQLINLIDKVKSTMEKRAQLKGLLFEIEAVGPLPSLIFVDESRITQILVNLIGNAIKFTENGFIKMQIEAQKNETGEVILRFNIIDSGIGISNENQLELFQSFTQVDYSNTRKYGGIGLGLALSRRLADQLDGEVNLVKSELGIGSTFCLKINGGINLNAVWHDNLLSSLYFPKIQLEFIHEFELPNKKILIVEDSEDNQEIFKYFLNLAGTNSDIAANGKIAVEKVKNFDYDAILMDLHMPVMDGIEAAKKIRNLGYKNPIIALTAHASIEAKMNCLASGFSDFVTKPVTQETLIHKIKLNIEEKKNDFKQYDT